MVRGIINLRDCGGLPAANGRRLRAGLLYRSGDPGRLRGAALRDMQSLGVRTIVDLRAPYERRHGLATLPGVRVLALPVDIERLTRARLRGLLHRRNAEDAISAVMASVYRDMVDLAISPMGTLLQLLLDPAAYPVLIHCRAGKDRTGFACAVIQRVLGAPPEAVLHDYLRSNASTLPVVQKSLTLWRWLTLGLFPVRNFEIVYTVQAHYLHAAFDRIDAVYGGLAAYLEQGGFTRGSYPLLQAQLLEMP